MAKTPTQSSYELEADFLRHYVNTLQNLKAQMRDKLLWERSAPQNKNALEKARHNLKRVNEMLKDGVASLKSHQKAIKESESNDQTS